MREINIWELGEKISIRPKLEFISKINDKIHLKYKSKNQFYFQIRKEIKIPISTFKNILKPHYYKGNQHGLLDIFLKCCYKLEISYNELQENIISYKTHKGYNIIENPKLPIKISPVFDMILAHNIADGTVINPKRKRQIYFGYRQFDDELRELYVRKIESLFGEIKFKKGDYYKKTTRPYCPPVLSQLFFKEYDLNSKSFLSLSARIPEQILTKNKDHLLAVLLAFIIDEGNIDSTLIVVKLKNPDLCTDLEKICKKLKYDSKLTIKREYGSLYIKREGMKKLFKDYKKLLRIYPVIYLGKNHKKIESGLKIYKREIYKTEGNRNVILNMIKNEDLTVNQIAQRINMTRQGVRQHINILEREDNIIRKGYYGRKNIIYGAKIC